MEIGRRSGAQIHLEHYRTQPDSAGDLESILEPVERAKSDGVDVTLETYPYPVGSSFPQSFFPSWFHEGGPESMLELLADGESLERVISGIVSGSRGSATGNMWSHIGSEKNKHLEGMLFDDVAAEWGVSVEEMMCRVMLEEDLNCGFRGAPPASVARVAAGRSRHHGIDATPRLHGRFGTPSPLAAWCIREHTGAFLG